MADDDSQAEDGVGYRRPPRHSRFSKGRSGNPNGRPKGSGSIDGVTKTLRRKVSIVIDGRRERVGVTDAIALQMTKQALAGHVGAGKEIMRLAAQEAEIRAKAKPITRKGPSKIQIVVIDPKDCSPGLERLGVVVNINGQLKIEPWVLEAAYARNPRLASQLSDEDRRLIANYTRKAEDKVGDPGRPMFEQRKRDG